MERTIKVTGKAKISVAPDTLQVIINLSDIRETYDQSRELSIECANQIQNSIERLGFGDKDLKTCAYSISAEYQSYQDKDKSWQQQFKGYRFTHKMKLEFPIDNILLGQVIRVLNGCSVQPNIEINYTINNPEPAKNELLAKAVADSKAKAQIMTQAAGVALGDVFTIDYSWGEIDIIHSYETGICETDSCYKNSTDFTPEDIDLSDTVTVIWLIK